MYNLVYLPAARQDMIDIVRYVSKELCNPTAARRLAVELIEAGERILDFPYAHPAYTPIRPLKHEYRKTRVSSYMMFYWVDEAQKLETIARVVYAKRELSQLLGRETGAEIPNEETLAAIRETQELKKKPNKKTYGSFAEFLEDIDA